MEVKQTKSDYNFRRLKGFRSTFCHPEPPSLSVTSPLHPSGFLSLLHLPSSFPDDSSFVSLCPFDLRTSRHCFRLRFSSIRCQFPKIFFRLLLKNFTAEIRSLLEKNHRNRFGIIERGDFYFFVSLSLDWTYSV